MLSMDKILLTPGPINTSFFLKKHISEFPDMSHREKRFKDLLLGVKDKLKEVYPCKEELEVAVLNGSGTTALEAMTRSFGRNKRNLVIINGVYGNRIYNILRDEITLKLFSVTAHEHWYTHDELVMKIRDYILDVDNVFVIHHETTTGVLNDINFIAKFVRDSKPSCRIFADCTSSFGVEEIDWENLDGICFSSNKCLESIPGVGVVMYKKNLIPTMDSSGELTNLRKYLKHAIPFTPNTLSIWALDFVLNHLKAIGGVKFRKQTYDFRMNILRKIKLDYIVPKEYNSSSLTTFVAGFSVQEYEKYMYDNDYVIYNMNNGMTDCFRLSVMGNIQTLDLEKFVELTKTFISEQDRYLHDVVSFR